ncbi:MAG TPA: hypothetical protein VD962_00450 [Rubricoccaceae bacterium]|nr:hypothetical protein [Rubricoccaceae bacterium]
MNLLHLRLPLVALALAITFAGCDNAGSDTDNASDAEETEAAAVVVANAIAVDGGGALNDAAGIASFGDGDALGGGEPGCTVERSFDPATMTWTRTIDCERGDPDGAFYAAFSRTHELQFFNDGVPQQPAEGADSLHLVIVDGTGVRWNPVLYHELQDIGGDFAIGDLDEELVTVNGTYNRSALDSVRTRRAIRTVDYDLALTFDDVRGPRRVRHNWHRAVSGTLSGTYDATVTIQRAGSTQTREVHRTFTIVFGGESDPGVATLRMGGQTYRVDLETGMVAGVN